MNQIEILLRLSENAQDQGDEIAKRHNEERSTFIRGLLDLEKMVDAAKQNVRHELARWGVQALAPEHPTPAKGQIGERGPSAPSFLAKQPANSGDIARKGSVAGAG